MEKERNFFIRNIGGFRASIQVEEGDPENSVFSIQEREEGQFEDEGELLNIGRGFISGAEASVFLASALMQEIENAGPKKRPEGKALQEAEEGWWDDLKAEAPALLLSLLGLYEKAVSIGGAEDQKEGLKKVISSLLSFLKPGLQYDREEWIEEEAEALKKKQEAFDREICSMKEGLENGRRIQAFLERP